MTMVMGTRGHTHTVHKKLKINAACLRPWDNSMYFKYGGDVLCQSVMSHLNKCISVGSASLAFSMCIHHINVT